MHGLYTHINNLDDPVLFYAVEYDDTIIVACYLSTSNRTEYMNYTLMPAHERAQFSNDEPIPTLQRVSRELKILRGKVAVLVPAHNEQADITDTINSLRQLRLPPDDIVVISDNSTDATVAIATSMEVTVIETEGNQYKKAGALNAGFAYVTNDGTIPEYIITMDADTDFDPDFVARGILAMQSNPKLGVLSAVCHGKNGLVSLPPRRTHSAKHVKTYPLGGLMSWLYCQLIVLMTLFNKSLVWMQQIEYARAGAIRIRSNIHTMSGAGSIIRADAVIDLLKSHEAQGYESVFLYQERFDNLVEDFALTLDLKELGWLCTNNMYVVAHTDLMRTLPSLLRQRIRWVRGTIDELRRRKFRRSSQLSSLTIIFGLCTMPFFYVWPVLMTISLVQGDVRLTSFWLLALVGAYQAIMTRTMGWKAMLASFILVPDLVYGVIRHCWVISAVVLSVRRKHQSWE